MSALANTADFEKRIVIVGGGCFGLSTAYHLLKRGFVNVTVLDQTTKFPAPEAASYDINKIVRSSYADIFYARLAREAIAAWKMKGEEGKISWGNAYNESGVLVVTSGTGSYSDQAYFNDVQLGARIQPLQDGAAMRRVFSPDVKTHDFEGRIGYMNYDGGWVHSSLALQILTDEVMALGGRILPGKQVVDFVQENVKTIGVRCADRSEMRADLIVLAAGSWTASSFPSLQLGEMCLATAQIVGIIQLTPEEAKRYRNNPVYMDLNTGFYVFPPNETGLVKFAKHTGGYTNFQSPDASSAPVSTPVFVQGTEGREHLVPKQALEELREGLGNVYPELAAKPWYDTRMCWYTDSPDEDWVIGFHPSDSRIVLATSGSGHALKFLPVIGSLVADAIQGTLEQELVRRFAVNRQRNNVPVSRPGFPIRQLNVSQLT